MMEEEVKSILEWETPKSLKDVQAFLGFANVYRRFIEEYLRVCMSLTDAMKMEDLSGTATMKDLIEATGIARMKTTKSPRFNWMKECADTLTELKTRFTTIPISRYFNPAVQCVMEIDASDFAIRAVVS